MTEREREGEEGEGEKEGESGKGRGGRKIGKLEHDFYDECNTESDEMGKGKGNDGERQRMRAI